MIPKRIPTVFATVVLTFATMLTGWAQTFPLPIPTRPTSFPLQRPAITGTVVAWGDNRQGQTNAQAGLRGVVAVAAGLQHTVALKFDGTVVAWGNNGSGQSTVPAGLSNVVAIAAGFNHTVALIQDGAVAGRVVAWGSGGYGETTVPGGLSGVVAVSAGYGDSLALKSDGTIVAWGFGAYGQTTTPMGLTEVVAIAAGQFFHSVALRNDGTVVAWGVNNIGQTNVPSGLSEVVAIAAGYAHTVALKNDGLVGPNGATAKAQVLNGFMVGVSVIRGGHGYTEPPLVLVRGGGGSGATATAIVADGVVTGFRVTNPGFDYTSLPQVLVASPPFTPEVSLLVSRVAVVMRVVLGGTYQVQASNDLVVWTPTGPPFVAQDESITQEFVVADTGRFFRVVKVL